MGVQGIKEHRKFVEVTIANGEALSDSEDLHGYWLTGIQCPAAWTAADITLQVSSDDTTFANVYDDTAEYSLPAAASAWLLVEPEIGINLRYVKVRSGTSAVPVNQDAARTLVLYLLPIAS